MLRRLSAGYLLFLYLSDVALVMLALLAASWLRIRIDLGASGADAAFGTPPALFLIASVIWLLSFHSVHLYATPQRGVFWRELQRLMLGHSIACLLFFGVLYITYRDYSRLQSTYFITLLFAAILIHRVVLRIVFRLRGGHAARRAVLIIGTDVNAQRTGETVARFTWAGLRLVGYVQCQVDDPVSAELNRPILGKTDDLPTLIDTHQISEVIVALHWPESDYLQRVISLLQNHVVNIRLAPDYTELAYFHVSVENLGGIPLIGLREEVLSSSQRLLKRLFDIGISATILLFGWPLMLVIGLAIWLDSRGTVIIRQKRAGEHGRLFTMYKFRSMYGDALPVSNAHKQPGDPRITRVGRFIRRTSLDEMPQFINVLRGEMSLVGPRPEMPGLVDQYEPWQRKRFEVPQGLTGWWQINGRADRPMHLNTEDDLFYIRHYSLWLDFQIIFRTILVVIMGRGAY